MYYVYVRQWLTVTFRSYLNWTADAAVLFTNSKLLKLTYLITYNWTPLPVILNSGKTTVANVVAHFVYLSYTPTCQTDTVNMTVQVQTVKTVRSVFLPACFSREPQQVGCTRSTCNSEGTSTDLMNGSLETVFQNCAQHSFICWYVVCRSHLPCIAPILSFKSRCSQRSEVPLAGRQEGRSGTKGIGVG